MLGLIESEIERDLSQRASVSETPENTEDYDEQKKAAISDNSTEDYEEAGNRINSKMLEWLWRCRTLILS